MIEPLHIILVVATIALLIQASRRTMAGSLTLVALMCLVVAVMILSVRNKALRTSMEEERNLSLRSIEDKVGELEACQKDVSQNKVIIGTLESDKKKMQDEKNAMATEIEGLKSEVTEKAHLAVTVEELHSDITVLKEKSEMLQADLDASQQQISVMDKQKFDLTAKLEEALRKLAEAEAAKESVKQPPAGQPAPEAVAPPEAQIPPAGRAEEQ